MGSRVALFVAVLAAAVGLGMAFLGPDLFGGGDPRPAPGRAGPSSRGDGVETGAKEPLDHDETTRRIATAGSASAPRPTRAVAPETQASARGARHSEGLSLTGVALRGRSDEPAAGVELVLVQGDDFAFVTTDAAGRFETDARYAAGVVEVRHRRSPPDGPRPVQLRAEPNAFELTGGEPGAAVDVVVRLHEPEGVLAVEAVQLDGAPVPGAEVALEIARTGDRGRTVLRAVTGPDGLARIGLDALGDEAAAGVVARLEEGDRVALTSEFLRLETPIVEAALQRPLRLVLMAPGAIDITVTARDGSPAPARMVLVDDMMPDLGWWTGPVPRTDRAGEATAEGLPPGRYRLHVRGADGVAAQEVDVGHGERSRAPFVLDADRIELAVSGRLVDADGAPLAEHGVDVRVLPAGTRDTAPTDADGCFEHFAPRGETVVVDAGEGLFSDVYDPGRVEVPFGATDVVLRRVRDIELRHVSFEVVREGTDERVRDVLVMTFRAPDRGDYAFHRAPDGLASPRLPIDDGTTLVVEAPGHRRAEVTLAEVLESADEDGIGRVEVRPGFARTVRVVDAEGGAPVEGARIAANGREVARTGPEGAARLDLDAWPTGGIAVTADGFDARVWAPEDGAADLAPAVIEVRRAR